MNLAKYGIGIVSVLAATAGIAACGSSSGGGDGGGTGGETSGSAGTSSIAQGGAAGGATSGSGGAMCTSVGTPAGCPDLVTCMNAHCSTQTTSCFGAGYATANFSGGTCSAFLGCIGACSCTDFGCLTSCIPSSDCQTCQNDVDACESANCQAQETACPGTTN
jgi:hypothetical protein